MSPKYFDSLINLTHLPIKELCDLVHKNQKKVLAIKGYNPNIYSITNVSIGTDSIYYSAKCIGTFTVYDHITFEQLKQLLLE